MRITELLDKRSISLDSRPATKKEALEQAVSLMIKSGNIKEKEAYRRQVFAREEEGSTGIGEGIAVPHGKCSAVLRPGIAAMVVRDGVDFDSLDAEPVTLIFLIAAPDTDDNVHLDVLSRLSVLLMNADFCDALRSAGDIDEFYAVIEQADGKEAGTKELSGQPFSQTSLSSDISAGSSSVPGILAVTSCPTGIAHTYMAAEAIEKAARARNCAVKIETRGSAGVRNELTDMEIAQADCIIIAADTKVPMGRFDGKKVIVCRVSDGIRKADELLERAAAGEGSVYHLKGQNGDTAQNAESLYPLEKSSAAAHQIYAYLMNGVSHMLPFVVGGGILTALAFLIDGRNVDLHVLDAAQRSSFGSITPLAAWLKNLGSTAFDFMLPVLAGFTAMAVGDRPALALGFVGGILASEGKSGFLGALAAGFLAGFVIRILRRICSRLPQALEKIAPVLLYPLFGILIMGLMMSFIIEPVMGSINTMLHHGLNSMGNSSRVLLGFVLGGMMAVDMGGPFNKAAYVFGTAAVASGDYEIMAAVMIGGMTPPCGIALAALFFQNKFTKEERGAAPVNFLLGLSFITEGAIPYAACDPVHVLPACIAGSGLAGALSMVFGCTLMAPHGGIFVFPVTGNAGMYVAALAFGTLLTAVLLGVFRKKI